MEPGGEITEVCRSYRHVLPPKFNGFLEIYERMPRDSDVVLVGHVGLDKYVHRCFAHHHSSAYSFAQFISGALVNETLETKIWRYAPDQIPSDRVCLIDCATHCIGTT